MLALSTSWQSAETATAAEISKGIRFIRETFTEV